MRQNESKAWCRLTPEGSINRSEVRAHTRRQGFAFVSCFFQHPFFISNFTFIHIRYRYSHSLHQCRPLPHIAFFSCHFGWYEPVTLVSVLCCCPTVAIARRQSMVDPSIVQMLRQIFLVIFALFSRIVAVPESCQPRKRPALCSKLGSKSASPQARHPRRVSRARRSR